MSAAINVEVTLDDLRKFVPKFVKATTEEVGKEMFRQAELMVRADSGSGLLAITAPPDGSKLGDSEKIGQKAVERDLNKVFLTASLARAILKRSGQRGALAAFNRYMRPGNPDYSQAKALDFLNGQVSTTVRVDPYITKRGKRVSGYTQNRQAPQFGDPRLGGLQFVADAPSQQVHRSKRDNRGKVKSNAWVQLVMKKGLMTAYTNKMKSRVGLLKAGWAKAAKKARLKLSFPPFVNRNLSQAKGDGRSSVANPLNMFVELVNQAPNASTVINEGAVRFVVRLRQDNIRREMENKIAALARAA